MSKLTHFPDSYHDSKWEEVTMHHEVRVLLATLMIGNTDFHDE